jgi:DNA primase
MDAKDEIKDKLDIAEVIGGYLELKSAGMNGYKAICPFHSERSPSFHVSKEKQIWHCFGCGKGGDVISFVMEMDGLDFRQALEFLAAKAGVKLPENNQQRPKANSEQSIYDLNELAGKLFETLLNNHDSSKEARQYLEDRGFDPMLIKKFRLGFAPNGWDVLKKFLLSKGYSEKDIQNAGLIKSKSDQSGFIDQFRNRVTIPIRNAKGQICGFTARALSADDKGPKYLNTPETLIFQKRSILYGLFEGRTAIRSTNKVIIVEGNLDVIASHKAAVEYVVASSGTALTENQLQLLKRYTTNLHFCFDTDSAGFNAASRGINLARQMGFNVNVLRIPEELGKDPDDVVRKNKEAWQKIVEEPISIMQFYFDRTLKLFDPNEVNGKKAITEMLMPEITKVNDIVEREYWLQKLSDIIRIDITTLKTKLNQTISSNSEQHNYSKQNSAENTTVITKKISSRQDRLERLLLGLEILDYGTGHDEYEQFADYVNNSHLAIYKVVKQVYSSAVNELSAQETKNKVIDINAHLAESDQTIARSAIIEAEQFIQDKDLKKVCQDRLGIITELKKLAKENRQKTLLVSIREAERIGDQERLRALMAEYQKLLS